MRRAVGGVPVKVFFLIVRVFLFHLGAGLEAHGRGAGTQACLLQFHAQGIHVIAAGLHRIVEGGAVAYSLQAPLPIGLQNEVSQAEMAREPKHVQQRLGQLGGRVGPRERKRQRTAETFHCGGVLRDIFFVEGEVVRRGVQVFVGQGFRSGLRLLEGLRRAVPEHAGWRYGHGHAVQNVAAEE